MRLLNPSAVTTALLDKFNPRCRAATPNVSANAAGNPQQQSMTTQSHTMETAGNGSAHTSPVDNRQTCSDGCRMWDVGFWPASVAGNNNTGGKETCGTLRGGDWVGRRESTSGGWLRGRLLVNCKLDGWDGGGAHAGAGAGKERRSRQQNGACGQRGGVSGEIGSRSGVVVG